ncbi:hypothetical protein HN51_001143 [Arachis hypogaea]|uniref:B-like cyclin n=3 Tax=Arachis TaxID=3817 RepID=A0A445ESS6_ARAHY|nr:cyclin-D1-1 [Arachis duranensis]XP_025698719.1 cyclin-D1-1 [Arachis hypogaea]QHO49196.1 Cyclin [Arachis hypogaea]RYR78535.1 hypothetical protein Ahy_A01g003356 isoform A [Arachis hypogaea]
MSVSPKHSACTLLDLHCNEATSDVVYLDSNIHSNYEFDDAGSNNALLWSDSGSVDEEDRLLSLLDSELDQVQERTRSLIQLRKTKWLRNAREEAINWILKVCAYYSFRPETAYLSAIYLDRFLLSHTLKQDKTWPLQLLSVACLSLAAKMEETKVPLLLDLQMVEPRFLFKPKTVQRMELLVMATLKWQLRVITKPFDFAHLFILRLSCSSASTLGDLNYLASRVSDVIFKTCLVMDFLEFSPSTIAAAALLYVTDQYVDDLKLYGFHKNIRIDMVQKCHNLMKQTIQRSEYILPKTTLQLMPRSPTCVLDLADMQDNHSATHK